MIFLFLQSEANIFLTRYKTFSYLCLIAAHKKPSRMNERTLYIEKRIGRIIGSEVERHAAEELLSIFAAVQLLAVEVLEAGDRVL